MGLVSFRWNAVVEDDGIVRLALGGNPPQRWTAGVGAVGKVETVTLTASSFNALTAPTGAKAVIIDVGTATSLTLKAETGDATGIVVTPTSNPLSVPLILPLGSSPVLGLLNGETSDQDVTVYWL